MQDAEAIIAAYNAGGPEQAMLTKVCTFTSNKAKAVAILELSLSCTFAGVLAILSGPKLREFASCIHGLPECCIDGHAFCIWAANRTGLKDVPAIGVKLRREIKADYLRPQLRTRHHPSSLSGRHLGHLAPGDQVIESTVPRLALPFIAKGLQADPQDHQRRQPSTQPTTPWPLLSSLAQLQPVSSLTRSKRDSEFYRNRRTKKAIRKLPF